VGERDQGTASGRLRPSDGDRPFHAMQSALAARRYFLDQWTIKEIAAELGVSRFKVSRLIEWARTQGLVRIEIESAVRSDFELSAKLKASFGLRDALVVADLDGAAEAVRRELATVAGMAVAELIGPNDVVGISWGRTLDLVAEYLPELRARRVVQLVGGMATVESATGGIDLVRRFAAGAGAESHPLLVPLIVRSAVAAASLRQDPLVAKTLALIDDVTVAIAGVGAWDPPASRLIECFEGSEIEDLRQRGACADLCGLMFTSDGEILESWAEERRIGISADQLHHVPTVAAVGAGSEKRGALAAVLRSGMVDVAITDAGSARELVSQEGAAKGDARTA